MMKKEYKKCCRKGIGEDGAMSGLTRSPWSGFFLAAIGIVMMGFGIYRGEMAVVLEKAINICMECIGIG